jgi:hypothetical protein
MERFLSGKPQYALVSHRGRTTLFRHKQVPRTAVHGPKGPISPDSATPVSGRRRHKEGAQLTQKWLGLELHCDKSERGRSSGAHTRPTPKE